MAGAEAERIFEAVPPELRPAAASMLAAAMKIFKDDGLSERDDVCDDVFG